MCLIGPLNTKRTTLNCLCFFSLQVFPQWCFPPTVRQTWPNLRQRWLGGSLPAVAALTNTTSHPEHQTGQGLQQEPGERLVSITDVVFNNVRINIWWALVPTMILSMTFVFSQHDVVLIEAYRTNLYSLDSISSSNDNSANNTGVRQHNTKDVISEVLQYCCKLQLSSYKTTSLMCETSAGVLVKKQLN